MRQPLCKQDLAGGRMQQHYNSIADTEWPSTDLEYLGRCPACDSEQRTGLFESLRDYVFEVAPGLWTMWRCGECGAAYLDPRPSEGSISRAYESYYTQVPLNRSRSESPINYFNVKSRLRLGYFNSYYGYNFAGGLAVGRIVAAVMGRRRASADYSIRHLPPPSNKLAPLLDVGCGNGTFLLVAQDLGFSAIGLEPDINAAENAQSANLDVRTGTLINSGLPQNHFEHITLNHVFEHLHRPHQATREIFGLLKPGGRVWFSQPNVEAVGLRIFGEYWRGLEAPRHLCLYNPEGFANVLRRAGFTKIKLLSPAHVADFYFRQSLAICQRFGSGAVTELNWNSSWQRRATEADKAACRNPHVGESFTMIASKSV